MIEFLTNQSAWGSDLYIFFLMQIKVNQNNRDQGENTEHNYDIYNLSDHLLNLFWVTIKPGFYQCHQR